MSLLSRLGAVSSQITAQVADFFAKPETNSNEAAASSATNKTEKTSFFNWLGGRANTSTPSFKQRNAALNLVAREVDLSIDEIKANRAGEAARIYPAQSKQSGRTQAPAKVNPPPQIPERYTGGTLQVTLKSNDTQQTFVHRALHDHARTAGLEEADAKEFADKWTNKNTSFNYRANGQNRAYDDAEFQKLKNKDKANFELTKQFDAPILADLNRRVDAYTIVSNTVANQAPQTVSQVTLDAAGRIKNSDDALTQYAQNTYNPERRVWGDKINEMVDAAKQQGVTVDDFELTTDENGKQTAKFSISGANKQKLDDLFADTLSQTVKGEQASDEGQQQGLEMLADQGRVAWNASVNIVEGSLNTVIDAAMSRGGQDPVYSAIPEIAKPHVDLSGAKSKYESELMRRNASGVVDGDGIKAGEAIEAGVTIAAPIVVGAAIKPVELPSTLKSLGALPKIRPVAVTNVITETTANQPIQSIKNKFPNELLPTDGKIRGIAKIENGKIKADFQISTKQVDFVVDKNGNLILGKRHPTLASQGEVQAAGTIKIVHGKVNTITNLSGHYQPTIEEARKFPEILRKMGLDLRNTKLELSEFEKTPSGYVIGNGKIVVNEYLKY